MCIFYIRIESIYEKLFSSKRMIYNIKLPEHLDFFSHGIVVTRVRDGKKNQLDRI